MKSGSLRFEFEVKVKRNILVLFYHTELIIVSVLKTSKNLEGTCHLLMLLCWVFGGKCLSASVRTCLSASEFSVYFYYYFIWYHTLLVLTFWDNTPVSFWILCLCTFTLFYSKYWYVCMYRTHWSLSNFHILPVVSAYLTPSSQLPSFPTKIIDIGSNSNIYLLKCTSLFLSNAGNYSIDVSVSPWSISPQS